MKGIFNVKKKTIDLGLFMCNERGHSVTRVNAHTEKSRRFLGNFFQPIKSNNLALFVYEQLGMESKYSFFCPFFMTSFLPIDSFSVENARRVM